MWIFAFICIMCFIACLGYFLMSRIGNYLEHQQNAEALDNSGLQTVAVLGGSLFTEEVCRLLEENRIKVFHVIEPLFIETGRRFSFLLALSDSDADNIIFALIGKKIYNLDNMIAVCNDRKDESIFQSKKLRYVFAEGLSAIDVVKTVLKEMG